MKPEKVDALICGFSMMTGQFYTEKNLNSLVDLISLETEKELQELKSKLAKARDALELYADPFKHKDIIENETSIPDFYNDTDFGMFAREALKEIGE